MFRRFKLCEKGWQRKINQGLPKSAQLRMLRFQYDPKDS